MKSDICYATMRVSYKSMEMEKINDDICVRTYVICLSDIFLFKLLSSYFSIPFILFYLCSQFYLNTICTKDVFLPDFFVLLFFFLLYNLRSCQSAAVQTDRHSHSQEEI